MKKTLKSAIAVTLFVSAVTAAVLALPNMRFSIENNTSFPLGAVTIYNSNGTPTTIDVPGAGTFTVSISGSVTAAVINNQPIPNNGQQTNITLQSGIVVQVTLGGNQIVVQDQSVVQSDTKHGSQKGNKGKN